MNIWDGREREREIKREGGREKEKKRDGTGHLKGDKRKKEDRKERFILIKVATSDIQYQIKGSETSQLTTYFLSLSLLFHLSLSLSFIYPIEKEDEKERKKEDGGSIAIMFVFTWNSFLRLFGRTRVEFSSFLSLSSLFLFPEDDDFLIYPIT